MTSMGLGDHEAALSRLETMIDLARELGGGGAFLSNYKSAIFREVNDLEAAREASSAALEASEGLAFGMPRRFALSDLLQTALLAGDVGTAQTDWPVLWDDASEATGWTRWLILGRLAVARAEIARHAEPPDAAADWAAKAVEVTARTKRRKYEAVARSELGTALIALERSVDGLQELQRAVDLADELVNPVGRWRARAALAEGLLATGDEDAAAAAAADAGEIVTAFAATLAPKRAASLLDAAPVRGLFERVG